MGLTGKYNRIFPYKGISSYVKSTVFLNKMSLKTWKCFCIIHYIGDTAERFRDAGLCVFMDLKMETQS